MTNETNNTSAIISKVWSFATVLRDDGVGFGDYLEHLTYLLFLKMADEFSKPPYNRKIPIPAAYNWENLTAKRGAELKIHYTNLLRELSKSKGVLGQIFIKSQNKIQDPAKLFKLIDMIDKEQWSTMGADVKGKIYVISLIVTTRPTSTKGRKPTIRKQILKDVGGNSAIKKSLKGTKQAWISPG